MTIEPLPELVPGGTVSSALINGNFETLRLANNAVADRITALLAKLKNPPVFAATIDSLHLFGKDNREDGCNKLKAVELNENFAKFKASMRSIGILDKRFRDAVNGKSPTENFDILRSIEIIFEDLPTAPSSLTVGSLYNNFGTYEIPLTWTDNSDNETGFQIYQSVNSGDYSLIHTTSENETSYNVSIGSNPNEGDVYSFKIRSENDIGYSNYSNIDSLTIPQELPDPPYGHYEDGTPYPPSDFRITNITVGAYPNWYWVENSSISFAWQDNADNEDNIALDIMLLDCGEYGRHLDKHLAITDETSKTMNFNNLLGGYKDYTGRIEFKIRAANISYSPYSNSVSIYYDYDNRTIYEI